jgi:transposase
VLGYIEGRRAFDLAAELDVTRGSVNRWLRWYETLGLAGLLTGKPPGPAPRLSESQRAELTALIEQGPAAAGYTSGVWTGPMIGDLIAQRFGVRYHNHHVPRLLHDLGFSVQRPRRRLARADREAQALWLREKLPAINKKPPRAAA